jgi:hypothetical protein
MGDTPDMDRNDEQHHMKGESRPVQGLSGFQKM